MSKTAKKNKNKKNICRLFLQMIQVIGQELFMLYDKSVIFTSLSDIEAFHLVVDRKWLSRGLGPS